MGAVDTLLLRPLSQSFCHDVLHGSEAVWRPPVALLELHSAVLACLRPPGSDAFLRPAGSEEGLQSSVWRPPGAWLKLRSTV